MVKYEYMVILNAKKMTLREKFLFKLKVDKSANFISKIELFLLIFQILKIMVSMAGRCLPVWSG